MTIVGQDVIDYMNDLKQEQTKIHTEVTEICYLLKGAITWDESWQLTKDDRKIIMEVLKKFNKQNQGR